MFDNPVFVVILLVVVAALGAAAGVSMHAWISQHAAPQL